MSEERVTGERFEVYLRLVRALAVFPVEPWPAGAHRSYFQAAYDFAKRNGYQRKDLVDQVFEIMTPEQIAHWGKEPSQRGKKQPPGKA